MGKKNISINWLSMISIIISFIGGIFIISLDLPLAKNIMKYVPCIKKLDSARNHLSQKRTPVQNAARRYIKSDKYGFSELIKVIRKNKKNLSIGEPYLVYVRRAAGIGFKDTMQMFDFVFLGYKDKKRKPVGLLNLFDEWIKNFQQRYFLKWGFLIVIIGFLLNIASYFYNPKKIIILVSALIAISFIGFLIGITLNDLVIQLFIAGIVAGFLLGMIIDLIAERIRIKGRI